MNHIWTLILVALFVMGCNSPEATTMKPQPDQVDRMVNALPSGALMQGRSYLSIYSQIYSQTTHKKHSLTVTVSLRNTSASDTLYIENAELFDTHGPSLQKVWPKSIFIAPMETVEIVIDEEDQIGGTGGNFIFDWAIVEGGTEPLFEAVMISTFGQQGLSFTTQGVRIK